MTTILGIKIATIGDGALEGAGTLTDGRIRLATGVPSWDASNVYRSVLASFPSEISSDADFQTGSTSIGGLEVGLLRTDEIAAWLLRVRFARSTQLTTAITAAGTTVVLDAAVADDTAVMIGRECLMLGTAAGTTYSGCVRGLLGTRAAPHGVGAQDDTEVYLAGAAPVFDLPIELFSVESVGGSYSTETTLWVGVIHGVTWDGGTGLVKVTADSALDVLGRTTLCRRLWSGVERTRGDLGWLDDHDPAGDTATATPVDREYTYRVALVYDGEHCARTGLIRSAGGNTWGFRPTSGPVGGVEIAPFGGGPDLPRPNADGFVEGWGERVWQLFAATPGAPAVNDAGDALSTNAVTLALQLLTTTADGGNGDYDLGVEDLGCGIPASLIDVTGMEAVAEQLGDFAYLDGLYFPLDGKPVKAVDLITRILRPFGLQLVPRTGGKIGVAGLVDGAIDALAVSMADLLDWPVVDYRAVPAVSEVTVTFDERPGAEPRSDVYRSGYTVTRSVGGINTTLDLDAPGVGPARGERLGVDWTTRYSFPIPSIRIVTKAAVVDLWPGDVLSLTHGVLLDPDGARGLSASVCLVTSREVMWDRGVITYTLWWVSAIYDRVGRIAPSARVSSYSAPTVTIAANAFTTATYGYATDAAAWAALVTLAGNIAVLILDSDLSVRGTATLTGTGTNTLTLSSPSVDPVADDVIVLAAYDNVGAEEQARYAFAADANATLGAASDDAYQWTT